MTRFGLLLAGAALVGGVYLATASAGPPPILHVNIAATHAQPVAGSTFTGVTVTNLGGIRISLVRCDAQVGKKTLPAHVLRYYMHGVNGPAAVTCSWDIPKGHWLIARVTVGYDPPVTTLGPVQVAWRIR